ncbi:MAG: hypothetical protein QW303_08890, partial [Nitrososphaerota archaeon]
KLWKKLYRLVSKDKKYSFRKCIDDIAESFDDVTAAGKKTTKQFYDVSKASSYLSKISGKLRNVLSGIGVAAKGAAKNLAHFMFIGDDPKLPGLLGKFEKIGTLMGNFEKWGKRLTSLSKYMRKQFALLNEKFLDPEQYRKAIDSGLKFVPHHPAWRAAADTFGKAVKMVLTDIIKDRLGAFAAQIMKRSLETSFKIAEERQAKMAAAAKELSLTDSEKKALAKEFADIKMKLRISDENLIDIFTEVKKYIDLTTEAGRAAGTELANMAAKVSESTGLAAKDVAKMGAVLRNAGIMSSSTLEDTVGKIVALRQQIGGNMEAMINTLQDMGGILAKNKETMRAMGKSAEDIERVSQKIALSASGIASAFSQNLVEGADQAASKVREIFEGLISGDINEMTKGINFFAGMAGMGPGEIKRAMAAGEIEKVMAGVMSKIQHMQKLGGNEFHQYMMNIVSEATGSTGTALDQMMQQVDLGKLASDLGQAMQGVTNVLSRDGASVLNDQLSNVTDTFEHRLGRLKQNVTEVFVATGDQLMKILKPAFDAIMSVISPILNALKSLMESPAGAVVVWTAIAFVAVRLFKSLMNMIRAFKMILGFLKDLKRWLLTIYNIAKEQFGGNFFKALANQVGNAVRKFAGWVSETFGLEFGKVVHFFESGLRTIIDSVKRLINTQFAIFKSMAAQLGVTIKNVALAGATPSRAARGMKPSPEEVRMHRESYQSRLKNTLELRKSSEATKRQTTATNLNTAEQRKSSMVMDKLSTSVKGLAGKFGAGVARHGGMIAGAAGGALLGELAGGMGPLGGIIGAAGGAAIDIATGGLGDKLAGMLSKKTGETAAIASDTVATKAQSSAMKSNTIAA